jgi:ribosomal protein L7Ae-like RNA K-turn-binding protein
MKTEKIRGLLGLARRARALTVGSRETRAGLRRGDVRLVLLAGDGSERDRSRLLRAAREAGTPARIAGSRAELGSSLGRGEVAVCGVTDPHLAAEIRGRLDVDGAPSDSLGSAGGQNEGQMP